MKQKLDATLAEIPSELSQKTPKFPVLKTQHHDQQGGKPEIVFLESLSTSGEHILYGARIAQPAAFFSHGVRDSAAIGTAKHAANATLTTIGKTIKQPVIDLVDTSDPTKDIGLGRCCNCSENTKS